MHTVNDIDLRRIPEHVRTALWTGHSLGSPQTLNMPTGYPSLDAQLPGAGWPSQTLIEILPTLHCWHHTQLLRHAAQMMIKQGGSLLLITRHLKPYLPAWHQDGIPADRIILIQTRTEAESLWSIEKALQAKSLTMVVGWLSHARPDQLRRLHIHAQQHPGLLFAIRPFAAKHEPSASPLRIAIDRSPSSLDMEVQILKRRGAPFGGVVQLSDQHVALGHLIQHHHDVALDRIDTALPRELALQ